MSAIKEVVKEILDDGMNGDIPMNVEEFNDVQGILDTYKAK